MGLTPRHIHAVADRLHDIADSADREGWTAAQAHGAVDPALEQLRELAPPDDTQMTFTTLPICYEAEFA